MQTFIEYIDSIPIEQVKSLIQALNNVVKSEHVITIGKKSIQQLKDEIKSRWTGNIRNYELVKMTEKNKTTVPHDVLFKARMEGSDAISAKMMKAAYAKKAREEKKAETVAKRAEKASAKAKAKEEDKIIKEALKTLKKY